MEGKKISFGFKKTKKIEKPVVEERRDYIECLEEKSIKVVGGETVEEETPLIIPMKPNTLITAERLKEIAEKVEKDLEEPPPHNNIDTLKIKEEPPDNETLDQMAVRELLQNTKANIKEEKPELTVPVPAKPIMEGEKESTLDDYESVPVQDFGMAMLRGMGWTPGTDQSKYKQPQLRPKGLGLGADKVVKENQKNQSSKDKDEELSIVKNSFVKIVTGKYSGFYGKVVSLDEDNGRVMVDIAVKKETVSLSEFMMRPVTKAEFDRDSKVINADSYEEYKRSEKSKSSKNESPKINDREASSSQKSDPQEYRERNREDIRKDNAKNRDRSERHRKDSTSSEEERRRKKKDKKKYSSNDSLSSVSDSERRRKHRHKNHKKKYSSESDSDRERKHRKRTPEGKRDIDKKRKGKKKKRDRDRSPNYRKHRK